jgi:hypothetical protein
VLAILFFQAITGAQTPACLFAANNSVETVTPPTSHLKPKTPRVGGGICHAGGLGRPSTK